MKRLIYVLFAIAALTSATIPPSHAQRPPSTATVVQNLGTVSGNGPHVTVTSAPAMLNYSFTVPAVSNKLPKVANAPALSTITLTSDPGSNGASANVVVTIWGGSLATPIIQTLVVNAASTRSVKFPTVTGTSYRFSLAVSNPIGFALVMHHAPAAPPPPPRR